MGSAEVTEASPFVWYPRGALCQPWDTISVPNELRVRFEEQSEA